MPASEQSEPDRVGQKRGRSPERPETVPPAKRARTSEDGNVAPSGPSSTSETEGSDFAIPDIKGTVYIEEEDKATLDAQVSTLFASTPKKVELSFVCDGSYKPSASGYGIVFKRFRPGQDDDGKEVQMGWKVPQLDYGGSQVSEALAIIQSIRIAGPELKAALELIPASDRPSEVTIKTLSDCQALLLPLKTRVYPPGHSKSQLLRRFLLREIAQASHDFHDELEEFEVTLRFALHWVKAHTGKVPAHTAADKAARKACRETFALLDGITIPYLPDVLSLGLKEKLDEIYSSSTLPANKWALPSPNSSAGTRARRSQPSDSASFSGLALPTHNQHRQIIILRPMVFDHASPKACREAIMIAMRAYLRVQEDQNSQDHEKKFRFTYKHTHVFVADGCGNIGAVQIDELRIVANWLASTSTPGLGT